MKRTILAILVVGLFAGVGSSAIAKDTTAGNPPAAEVDPTTTQKPAKSTKQTNPAKSDDAASSASKAEYKAAKDKAQTEYKDAKAKCDSMQGDAMRMCMTDAKTAQTDALAQAKTQWDSQAGANATDGDGASRPGKEQNGNDGAKPAKDDMSNSSAPKKTQ